MKPRLWMDLTGKEKFEPQESGDCHAGGTQNKTQRDVLLCCVTLRHRHFGAERKIHRGRVDDDNQRELNKCAVIRVDR